MMKKMKKKSTRTCFENHISVNMYYDLLDYKLLSDNRYTVKKEIIQFSRYDVLIAVVKI